ncbi:MAG: hypothetical protein LBS43_07205 [Prevotellaceae bacterium]|nr:hypothetical protein [Prevotellaceae bacterium]
MRLYIDNRDARNYIRVRQKLRTCAAKTTYVRGKIYIRARQNLRTCAAKSPHVRGGGCAAGSNRSKSPVRDDMSVASKAITTTKSPIGTTLY